MLRPVLKFYTAFMLPRLLFVITTVTCPACNILRSLRAVTPLTTGKDGSTRCQSSYDEFQRPDRTGVDSECFRLYDQNGTRPILTLIG